MNIRRKVKISSSVSDKSKEDQENAKNSCHNNYLKERPIIFSGDMVSAILEGRKAQTRRIVNPQPHFNEMFQEIRSSKNNRLAYSNGELFDPNVSPYGNTGDMLYVREAWKPYAWDSQGYVCFQYKDGGLMEVDSGFFPDDEDKEEAMYCKLSDLLEAAQCPKSDEENYLNPADYLPWKPSIHMPKNASRIKLEVKSVHIERLNEISSEDAIAEGISFYKDELFGGYSYKDYAADASGYGHPDHDYPCLASPTASFVTLWEKINGAGSWELNPFVWVVDFKVLEVKSQPMAEGKEVDDAQARR